MSFVLLLLFFIFVWRLFFFSFFCCKMGEEIVNPEEFEKEGLI